MGMAVLRFQRGGDDNTFGGICCIGFFYHLLDKYQQRSQIDKKREQQFVNIKPKLKKYI